MLAQLEKCGLVENLGEAVSSLAARADEVRLDRAVELALAEVVLPAFAVLSLLRGAGVVSLFNSCSVIHNHEQHSGATVELGADGVEQMTKQVAEEHVSLGGYIAGCNSSLARTGNNFDKAGAPINRAVYKHAK
eukprot:6177449-Pleurochrysis_carterae.AAC.1